MKIRIFIIRIFLLLAIVLPYSCDRKDLNDLYRMAAENELMVKQLEETAFDITEELKSLHNLTLALQERLYVTKPIQKTDNGYIFTFGNSVNGDSIPVEIHHGKTPLVEINKDTKTWWIDGIDTEIPAEGKDGVLVKDPQVRISTDGFWEYSADGGEWVKTQVKAGGTNGKPGDDAQVGINEDGNWTIGGAEVQPPVAAWGKDGLDALVPMVDVDKSVTPYEWKISTDGGVTWTRTGVKAQAKDGKPGTSPNTNPYIKQITVDGDVITFKFSVNIPGTSTNIQKVTIKRLTQPLSIALNTSDLEYLHSSYWLLFGVNETRTLRYTVTGTATSVEVVNMPDFLKATVDMSKKQITFTSSKETGALEQRHNFIQLLATNAEGEHALVLVCINRIYKLDVKYSSESYVWEAFSMAGNKVTEWVQLGDNKYSSDPGTYYFYGYPSWDPFWSSNPHPTIQPYPVTVKPLLVKDIDGNTYRAASNGNTTWLVENLRVKHYNDGRAIPAIDNSDSWENDKNGAYCYYNNDESQAAKYGLLYNAYVVKTEKVCPQGWRVATEEDWYGVESWLENSSGAFVNKTGWRGNYAGQRLKWMIGWDGYTRPSDSFQSMFEYLPGGMRRADGTYAEKGTRGYWWTSGEDRGVFFYRGLGSEKRGVYRHNDLGNNVGLSVRCVREE